MIHPCEPLFDAASFSEDKIERRLGRIRRETRLLGLATHTLTPEVDIARVFVAQRPARG
jgi:hypothetical protein